MVIGVEKKSIPALQDDRTIRKIHTVDEHIMLAFAGGIRSQNSATAQPLGLSADARVLVDYARVECQSYKLTLEDPVTVGYIARYIANIKQVRTLFTAHYLIGSRRVFSASRSQPVAVHSASRC